MTQMLIKSPVVEEQLAAFEVFDFVPESGVSWAYAEINFYPAAPGNQGYDYSISQGTLPKADWLLYTRFTETQLTAINQWWAKLDVLSTTSGRSDVPPAWDNGGAAGEWVDLWLDWQLFQNDKYQNGIPEDRMVRLSIAPDNGAGAPNTALAVVEEFRMWAYRGAYEYVLFDVFTGTNTDLAGLVPATDRRNFGAGGTAWRDVYWDESNFDQGWWRRNGTGRAQSSTGNVEDLALYVIDTELSDNLQISAEIDFYGTAWGAAGLVGRVQDSGNFWLLAVKNPSATDPVFGLYKVAGGTHTLVDGYTLTGLGPFSTTGAYQMRLSFVGSVITGTFDMTNNNKRLEVSPTVTATDAAYNTETDAGIWTDTPGTQVDNWLCIPWPLGFNPIVMTTTPVTSTRTDTGLVLTNVYFYEGSNDPDSPHSSAGFYVNDTTLDFFDVMDFRVTPFSTNTFLIKVEAVSGDTGDMVLREYGVTPVSFNTWNDLYRFDIYIDSDNEGLKSGVVDVTVGIDDGTGNPMAGYTVTKRITVTANSTGP